jgi:hypothetical protein
MASRAKGLGEFTGRLRGPAQRRLGVAAGVRVDQRLQRRHQPRIKITPPLASPAGPSHAPSELHPPLQLGQPGVDRLARGAGGPGDLGDAPTTQPRDPAARSSRRCRSSRYGQLSEYVLASAASGVSSTPAGYDTPLDMSK